MHVCRCERSLFIGCEELERRGATTRTFTASSVHIVHFHDPASIVLFTTVVQSIHDLVVTLSLSLLHRSSEGRPSESFAAERRILEQTVVQHSCSEPSEYREELSAIDLAPTATLL